MGRFFDELQSRPVYEFVGGPLDGCKLPIDLGEHPDTVRVSFEPDNGPAVVDFYTRDLLDNKLRFDRREPAGDRRRTGTGTPKQRGQRD